MNENIWKIFVSLGVPGLSLGVFFMLFKAVKWKFSKVPSSWVGPIVVIYLILTFIIVFYALTIYAPLKKIDSPSKFSDPVAIEDMPGLSDDNEARTDYKVYTGYGRSSISHQWDKANEQLPPPTKAKKCNIWRSEVLFFI